MVLRERGSATGPASLDGEDEVVAEEEGKGQGSNKKERAWWVDWSRAQAVYCVVGAHCMWTAFDDADFDAHPPSQDQLLHNETVLLLRYGTDIGQHTTIPMFFMMSGFVGSLTWRGGDGGMFNFMQKRFLRLLVPYFVGLVFSVWPRDIMDGNAKRAGYAPWFFFIRAFTSEMWFLYVLWAFASALWPWTHSIHLAASRLSSPGSAQLGSGPALMTVRDLLPTVGLGAAIVFGAYSLAGVMAPVPLPANVLWLVTVPCLYVINISCAIVGGQLRHTQPRWSRTAFLGGAVSIIIGTFVLSFPPVTKIGNPLSLNMYFVFNLYACFYIFGFYCCECKDDLKAALQDYPLNFGPIWLLLFSFLWPAAAFWGSSTIGQQASYITYMDPVQRTLGIVKTWFWVTLNILFSAYACNEQYSPSFHKHITQSSLVMYTFSRFFESVWLKHVFPQSKTGYSLAFTFWIVYLLTIICSMSLYFVFTNFKITRKAFGMTD